MKILFSLLCRTQFLFFNLTTEWITADLHDFPYSLLHLREDLMADFIFRVASAKLTDEQKGTIASAIQGAVLTELARLDLGGGAPAADCLFRPVNWRGGMMIPVAELAGIAGSTLTVATTQTK